MEKSKKRKKISITKYDIANRDERGIYRKDEWASISDIGKFYNNELAHFLRSLSSKPAK